MLKLDYNHREKKSSTTTNSRLLETQMNRFSIAFPFFCLALAAPAAGEDFMKFGEETFELSGGFFLQQFDTNVRVDDPETGEGVEIGLENDLGYEDDDTTGYVLGTWRFAERHRLSVGYFNSERDVTAIALEDIDLGDGEFIPAGAGYESQFEMSTVPFAYTYSFTKSDSSEFYGTVGFHWMSIDYNLVGALGIGEEEFTDSLEAEAEAPMPLLGIGYDYYLNDRWKMALSGEGFYIKLDDDTFSFEGSVYNLELSTEYYVWNNFAIGAALTYFRLDVDLDDSDWKGSLDYEYWGPTAFIKARF
jgi:hypothetical protein